MYQETLVQNLTAFSRRLKLGNEWIFQQDNDSKHYYRALLLWNDLPIEICVADSLRLSLGSNLTYLANPLVEGHSLVLSWVIESLVD